MWAIALAESPWSIKDWLQWSINNWWYFQYIFWAWWYWSTIGKYKLFDKDFWFWYCFIYRNLPVWSNKNSKPTNNDLNQAKELWCWLNKTNWRLSKSEILKIWKILSKINEKDFLIYKYQFWNDEQAYIQLFKEFQLAVQLRNSMAFIISWKSLWVNSSYLKKVYLTDWTVWHYRNWTTNSIKWLYH